MRLPPKIRCLGGDRTELEPAHVTHQVEAADGPTALEVLAVIVSGLVLDHGATVATSEALADGTTSCILRVPTATIGRADR